MTVLRLSPSGPNVVNTEGGPFQPGAGARLRLVEATSTCGTNPIPTVPATIGDPIGSAGLLILSLESPKEDLNYRATAVCDVQNPTTNVAQTVQLYWDTSPDGTNWTPRASNTHQVAAATTRQIRLDMPVALGSDYGVAANQARLYARCRIGAATGGGVALLNSEIAPGAPAGTSKGSIDLQLEECF